jgi:competence protein ComEA
MTLKSASLKNWIPMLAAMLLLSPFIAQAEPVNVNTADAGALAKALNGVGPAKAKAIVAYRDKNGPFKTVDQLAMVEGITQKLIDKNRADIKLGNDKGGEKATTDKQAPAGAPAVAAKPAKAAS